MEDQEVKESPNGHWNSAMVVFNIVCGLVTLVGTAFAYFAKWTPAVVSTLVVGAAMLIVPVALLGWRRWAALTKDSRKLARMTRCLPALFMKTEHLHRALSTSRLDAFHAEIQASIVSSEDDNHEIEIGSIETAESSGGIEKTYSKIRAKFLKAAIDNVMTDLTNALVKLTGKEQFCTSVKLFRREANDGFALISSFPPPEPSRERRSREQAYLAAGHSLAALPFKDLRANKLCGCYYFTSLRDAESRHLATAWPEMGKHIQSVILVPIIENNLLTAVLQVDSPEQHAFEFGIVVPMVECAAYAIGAMFQVSAYVRSQCGSTSWRLHRLANDLDAANDRIKRLESENEEFQRLAALYSQQRRQSSS